MATYVKRGNSWRAIIRRKGINKTESFPTKAAAIAWAAETEKDILSGNTNKIPNKTFGDLLDRYSEEVSIKKRGARWEQIRIKLFQTHEISKVMLADLSAADFSKWRDDRLKTVSAGSVIREMNILSNVMRYAVNEWLWLPKNHFSGISRPKKPAPRDRLITDDEIARILYCADYKPDIYPSTVTARVGAIMLFAIETGMRLKEMTRLTWSNVFIDNRYLTVGSDTKTGKRDVPLSIEAIRILNQLKSDDALVFQITESQVDSIFRKLKRKAGLSGFTFHDTKHLACTRLAQKISVFDLARMVGTRDLKTLLIYYNEHASKIAGKLD